MGMKFEYEGTTYNVPCMPKKEWGEWMTERNRLCRVPASKKSTCIRHAADCTDCIYASYEDIDKGRDNSKARKVFYYECFPEEKPAEKPSCDECANYKPKEESKELPKLTLEVFDRPACPEWAHWAAVDRDGKAAWFEKKPKYDWDQWYRHGSDRFEWIEGRFDASDWQHSLLEKVSAVCEKACSCANYEPKKQVLSVELPFKLPKLTKLSDKLLDLKRPEWAHWAAVDASGFAYWYERAPLRDILQWSPRESSLYTLIQGNYDASDWRNSLVYIYSDEHSKEEVIPCVPKEVLDPELLSWPTKWKYSKRKDLYYYKSAYQLSEWQIKYGEPQQVTFRVHDKIPADIVDVQCPLA